MGKTRLSIDDFFMLMASYVGGNTTPKSCRKQLEAMLKVILNQLKLNDEVYVHNFGTFYLRPYGGEIKNMGDPINGGTVQRFIKPRVHIEFKPTSMIEKAVNENDFEFEDKKTRRKYKKSEYKEIRNERRRKPKPTMEDIFCDIVNDINKNRREENGEV